jgi:nitrite reductase/ring-hydroxylating ferredoxin subunit
MTIERRALTKAMFWSSLAALGASAAGAVLYALYPRDARRPSADVVVARGDVPAVGGPPVIATGLALVHLAPGAGEPGGLLALSTKCTHLGCTAVWDEESAPEDPLDLNSGRFACACHGGLFTKTGLRVFGPPPRPLDTFPLRVSRRGDVLVNVNEPRLGTPENALRATPFST